MNTFTTTKGMTQQEKRAIADELDKYYYLADDTKIEDDENGIYKRYKTYEMTQGQEDVTVFLLNGRVEWIK